MDVSRITTAELLVILDITRRLAEQRMVQPLIDYVGSMVFELVAAESCQIVLFVDDDALEMPFARTRRGVPITEAHDQISRSILQRVRATLTPLLVEDAQDHQMLQSAPSVRALGIRSVLCVPLISYGQAVGAIYVENRAARGRFSEENLIPLTLFSHQVVVALENARRYESLEAQVAERTRALQESNTALQEANAQLATMAEVLREQGVRDALTGGWNRRYFDELLPRCFASARRYDHPLAIAIADIDNFKQINDILLHEGGDRVLTIVTNLFATHTRTSDIVARIGGDEFAILMPETDLQSACQVCERLRQIIAQHPWKVVAPDLAVTVSIGVAVDAGCSSASEQLSRADTRLYAAKRLGKNRVIVDET